MRVMGVDPGLTRCGLALIETEPGRAVTALDVDVVRTTAQEPLERRLRAVHAVADEWMEIHRPDVVAIERVFAQNQVSTAMGTAQAAGVVALAAMLVAFTIWLLSNAGWCDPDSLLQGHAAWHLLCAASAYLMFRLWASERTAGERTVSAV